MKKFKLFLFSLLTFISLILFNTSVSYSQWIPVTGSLGGDIAKLVVFNNSIYAGGTAYLFRSSNGGANWTSHLNWPFYAWSIAISGSNIYCGSFNGSGIYKSTNDGMNWNPTSLTNIVISDMCAANGKIYANAFTTNQILMSTNEGANWINIKAGLNFGVYKLAVSGGRIYAGSQGLHVSSNDGANWSSLFMSDNIDAISVSESALFIGTYASGIFRSTNLGLNWTKVLNTTKRVRGIDQYNNYVFIGLDTGFFASTNYGVTFFDKTQNLGNSGISSAIIFNGNLFLANANFLGGNEVAAWKRPLAEIIAVQQISSVNPEKLVLHQNYPNPFNPSTKINYEIKSAVVVTLEVFDLTGKIIETLVNDRQSEGIYEVEFDGAFLSSGIYFYKIHAGNYIETKKMIITK